MQNAFRGLMFAAMAATFPVGALADCPPRDSIDRYAETTRDALSALDGQVPDSLQRSLEDRYAAISVLRWHWQGVEAMRSDAAGRTQIAACLTSGRCASDATDQVQASTRDIARAPSDRLIAWAEATLECAPTTDVSLDDDAAADETPDDDVLEELPADLDAPAPEPTLRARTDLPVEDTVTLESLNADLDRAEAEMLAAQGNAPADPVESRDAVLHRAIAAMALGRLSSAISTLNASCLMEVTTPDQSPACEILIDLYEAPGARIDPTRILAFTDRLCSLNYARGCESLARYFGVSTIEDAHQAAMDHYVRACKRGDAEACASASSYHLAGRVSAPNPVLARDELTRSCDLGRLESCQSLADFNLRGVGGAIDIDRALELIESSCPIVRAQNAEACVAAADFILLNMEITSDPAALVRAYTKRACDIGHDIGCAWYAEDLEFGIGGDVDLIGAKQARLTACDLGHEKSCRVRS